MINKMLSVLIYLIILSLALLLGCSSVAEDSIINREPLTIEIDEQGEGRIIVSPTRNSYELGEEVEILAKAEKGWEFNRWTRDLDGDENPQKIIVDDDLSIGADFIEEDKEEEKTIYIIEIGEIEGRGRMNLYYEEDGEEKDVEEGDTYEYRGGTKLTVEADPIGQRDFIEWTYDLKGEKAEEITIEVESDLIIGAKFED